MTSLLRRFLPVSSTSKADDHDNEYSVEYSFAVEYSGPPVSFDIPQVVPVDVHRIPTASIAAPASLFNNLSLPVIKPIVKSDKSNKESSQRSNVGAELARSLVSRRHSGELQGSDRNFPCNSVDVAEEEWASEGLENGDGCASRQSDETGSSGTLGFSDSHDESNEASGSSDIEDLNDKPKMGIGRSGLAQPVNSELEEHCPGSSASSADISSFEEVEVENSVKEASHQCNRTSVVTFCDPQSSDLTSEEDAGDLEQAAERPVARSDVKKGLCHWCYKGSRFTDKEVCIVCGAKYCRRCVLRAMGSMPEGRKCVTCIGYRIDESKREYMGKSSKMLKRLLTKEEIKMVMRLEISCEANQLPPNLVCVNGRPLTLRELVLLQNCRYPPKKLRPGKYWYDKVSGLWGKEGEKPCQIISPQLDIGGTIKRNASNGNTNIMINNREITKPELWMLQLAGIHCEGHPHFWLSADGSFQEEGQKNVVGRLWDKHRTKFICAALSLPIPSESSNEEVENAADQSGSKNLDQKIFSKLLLVGCDQSGTSTIFKQAKILYDAPFSQDERENIKFMIQSNLYRYLCIVLEGREMFEEDCVLELKRQLTSQPGPSVYLDQIEEKNVYSLSPRLKALSDWMLQVMISGNLEAVIPAATREYAPLVGELLNDNGFQAAYNRRNEIYVLPRVAKYFLDRAAEISRADYEPSDMDILYAEGITSSKGVATVEFSFPSSAQDCYMEHVDQNDPLTRYQLIRVHASSLGENCKWLEMFEDVDIVLYCVSLTDYDEFHINSAGVCMNKMLASRNLFEAIITHPTFANKDFLLILNNFDLLEEKLEQVPLTQCDWFQDFNPVISRHPDGGTSNNNASLAQRAFHHIAVKFKRLFSSLSGRKLYVSPVSGLDANSVDEALKYVREVLKWKEEKPTVCVNESSSESIEASTYS